jgi:hypothetical protein
VVTEKRSASESASQWLVVGPIVTGVQKWTCLPAASKIDVMLRDVLHWVRGFGMDWIGCAKRAIVAASAFAAGILAGDRAVCLRRALAFEPLEPRLHLSAAGLVDVGTQPQGGLADKIVYIHGGHGYTADNEGNGAWSFQRSELFDMIEDLGNVDQMTFLADYLFRAGATVAPLRPVGHQTSEVVLDNDDAGVTFVGNWSNSSASVYFGSAGDVPYKFADTALTETAYARYQPNIPHAGFYPVYAWTPSGGNRATDQLYRVSHTGGITEVHVNHRRVGNGLVYLGTYYFDAGTSGYVDISNRSSTEGSVVVADMIRFGNGLGDIDRGGGVSGRPREDEAGLYWVKWHVDRSQGIPLSEYLQVDAQGNQDLNDRDATVRLSPRFAEFMNREQDGALADRVFVSFHSNASGGRGVLGLYNGNNSPGSRTPNQFLLANTLGREINDDLVAQNGQFEHNWFNRGSNVTLDRSDIEFGEINNEQVQNEFDATIVEVAFHDNQMDAELMRDRKVRDALARATYQGIVKYFRAVDGNTTPLEVLPAVPSSVSARSNAAGSVTIAWTPPVTNAYVGDGADGYRIYASANGYAFDGGTFVSGGATNSATLTGYDPRLPYYFKVVAVNEGGESPASEVLTVLPSGGAKQVLVVNGFDRNDRALSDKHPFGGGGNTVDRVRLRSGNSRDYVVQVAAAIHAAAPGVHVDSTSNEAVTGGSVNLVDYDTVIWILGEESTADDTFNTTEQTLVEQFITAGGNLFLSGAEIAWDLDQQNNGRTFFENTLQGNYVADDANTYNVTGATGGIFAGLSFSFDNGALYYNVDFPDVINTQTGAQSALTYSGGTGGNAAIQVAGSAGRGRIVMLGFPFETITTAASRAAVIDRALAYFGLAASSRPAADFNYDGAIDAADYTVWRRNKGTTVLPGTLGDADGNGSVDDADYQIWRAQFGTIPGAAGSASMSSVPQSIAFTAPQPAANQSPAVARRRTFVGRNPATYTSPRERWDLLLATLAADRESNALVATPLRTLERQRIKASDADSTPATLTAVPIQS